MVSGAGMARWRIAGLLIPVAAALVIGLPAPHAGRIFIDSATFLDPASGKAPLPWLLYRSIGTGAAAGTVQTVLSISAWAWCGWTMLGTLGACLGAALALALPLALWNGAILSESLALSLAAASIAATVMLAERWSAARCAVWAVLVVLFAAARIGDFLLVPFLALPLLAARPAARALAVPAVAAAALAAGLLWSAATTGEQERARLRMTSIVLDRVLADPSMEAFFVARGMPVEPALASWRGAAPLALYRREEFRAQTPLLQTWLVQDARATYASWLLRGAAHADVLARLAVRHADDAVAPLRGYATGIALRPVAETLAAPFALAAPPLGLWLAALLIPVAAALAERRVRRCDALALTLAAGVYVLAFAAYHGDAIEVDRHLLMARVLYRVVPWLALGCALRRWDVSPQSPSP